METEFSKLDVSVAVIVKDGTISIATNPAVLPNYVMIGLLRQATLMVEHGWYMSGPVKRTPKPKLNQN